MSANLAYGSYSNPILAALSANQYNYSAADLAAAAALQSAAGSAAAALGLSAAGFGGNPGSNQAGRQMGPPTHFGGNSHLLKQMGSNTVGAHVAGGGGGGPNMPSNMHGGGYGYGGPTSMVGMGTTGGKQGRGMTGTGYGGGYELVEQENIAPMQRGFWPNYDDSAGDQRGY